MSVDLEPHEHGVVLRVKALPGARSSGLRGTQDGALKVAVTQIAEKGKANRALAQVLAKQLGLRRAQLELIGGATTSRKQFLVRELDASQLNARITAALQHAQQ